ncbi:hypothetical protein, partial [Dokdonella sp.]|uniref:hypothetical protein n=1 Tax=Dokdonella sp. TaxID=2291710 RepID=UPI003C699684
AGGGTELVPALETAYALPDEPGMARSVIVITDGEIAAGGEAFSAARSQLGHANTFVFGVGANVNRPVIELLARAGNGEPFVLEDFNKADAVAERLRTYIDRPLLTNVEVVFEGFDAYEVEPRKVADLLAERPVVLVGRYRGPAQGQILISGATGNVPYQASVEPDRNSTSTSLSALRLLWARTRVQRLLDEQSSAGWGPGPDENNKQEITALSLDYGLLSPYTSFVAVDEVVRTDTVATAVRQPAISRTAAAPPPPPLSAPEPSYSVAGTGNALALIRTLDGTSRASLPRPEPDPTRVRVAGRDFELRDGRWVDLSYREDMTLLRLRADSSVVARLLESNPELVHALALGKRVVVVIGEIAVLIGPDGFSDIPEATLERLLRG